MARVYATEADYLNYTREATAPDGLALLLTRATTFLEARVFRLCRYDADPGTGLPTHPLVLAAFRDAVCAQVDWWDELGDSKGTAGVGWGSVGIGSANLSRSVTKVDASASPARQVAPEVGDILSSLDLTEDVLELGAVTIT